MVSLQLLDNSDFVLELIINHIIKQKFTYNIPNKLLYLTD